MGSSPLSLSMPIVISMLARIFRFGSYSCDTHTHMSLWSWQNPLSVPLDWFVLSFCPIWGWLTYHFNPLPVLIATYTPISSFHLLPWFLFSQWHVDGQWQPIWFGKHSDIFSSISLKTQTGSAIWPILEFVSRCTAKPECSTLLLPPGSTSCTSQAIENLFWINFNSRCQTNLYACS